MARFAAREAVRFALLMFAVSFATFTLVALSPIDPVQANVGQQALLGMSEAKRAQLAAHWDVGVPLLERYGTWLVDALHGDWGTSLRFNAPVPAVVGERFASSAALMLIAWALSGILGVALGMAAGASKGSRVDRVIRWLCLALSSTPTFWVAIVALMVFSVWLGWFPLGFSMPIGADQATVSFAVRVHHLALPALVLVLTGAPGIALHTREKAIEVMESDYVRLARARGESTRFIALRHGLRNIVLPALTLQLSSVGELVGGTVLVEQVFSYPGLGQAAVTAGLGGDAPLLVGIALFCAVLVFAGNLLADVLARVVDPRVGRGGRPCRVIETCYMLRGPDAMHASRGPAACCMPHSLGATIARASCAPACSASSCSPALWFAAVWSMTSHRSPIFRRRCFRLLSSTPSARISSVGICSHAPSPVSRPRFRLVSWRRWRPRSSRCCCRSPRRSVARASTRLLRA